MLDGVGAAERGDAEPVGPVGLVRDPRPRIQHGLGYLFAVARAIGQQQSPPKSRLNGDRARTGTPPERGPRPVPPLSALSIVGMSQNY